MVLAGPEPEDGWGGSESSDRKRGWWVVRGWKKKCLGLFHPNTVEGRDRSGHCSVISMRRQSYRDGNNSDGQSWGWEWGVITRGSMGSLGSVELSSRELWWSYTTQWICQNPQEHTKHELYYEQIKKKQTPTRLSGQLKMPCRLWEMHMTALQMNSITTLKGQVGKRRAGLREKSFPTGHRLETK